MIKRRKTKTVAIGRVKIGANNPISIQSMTKTDTKDVLSTTRQIKALERAGCEIVRVAVKDMDAAGALRKIKAKTNISLVADIHFNYKLALEAINSGVDGLRLNPGNIYSASEIAEIAKLAKKRKIPIRIGVNSGSLKAKRRNAKVSSAMVRSALGYIKILEKCNFYDIIVSLKASSITETVAAYQKLSKHCEYPFHLGITAAGLPEQGAIKSAIGIGALLLEGVGDTIRVSLAGDPVEEVKVGREILQSLGLRSFGPELIVCPTCGRCQSNVVKIAKSLKSQLSLKRPLQIAVMGCEVNGPGEAREADIGVACGKSSAILFKKGKIVKKLPEGAIVKALLKECKR